MSDGPRVSVIVAAYRPGDAILRVIDSLDAQTLPQDQFETIIIDDGSPDDTFERLQRFAATRPNMTVRRIDNSGWPSRPRNVATELARGEWVLFMDHDDTLYPDALRRGVEYARETDADLLSPKESKTSDVWWGMPALAQGNLPNVLETGTIDALLPMVPHKFYRRSFLLEHGIRFPEGRRMLWEDIYLNVEAWRHARRVAVLADTPVYLWHSSPANNSKTYGPRRAEFWDRLDDLFAFIDRTLDAPGYEDARRTMLLHQYRGRVLGRFTRILGGATSDEVRMALRRARRIQDAYLPMEWESQLGRYERARSLFLRTERTDLLERLFAIDAAIATRVVADEVLWRDGRLEAEVRGGLIVRGAGPLEFRRDGDRVRRILPPELESELPEELLDVTEEVHDFSLSLGVRDRPQRITWELHHGPASRFEELEGGTVTPVTRTAITVDLEHAAFGGRMNDSVWDCYAAVRWGGYARGTALKYSGPALAALVNGRAAVAYRNQGGNLSIDTEGRLRNVVKDSRPAAEDLVGSAGRLDVALPSIHLQGTTELPATVVLAPLPGVDGSEAVLTGSVVGGPRGARLEAAGDVPAGRYRLAFGVGDGPPLVSVFVARVDANGDFEVERRPVQSPRAGATARFRAWFRRSLPRSAAAARAVARKVRARR